MSSRTVPIRVAPAGRSTPPGIIRLAGFSRRIRGAASLDDSTARTLAAGLTGADVRPDVDGIGDLAKEALAEVLGLSPARQANTNVRG